MHLFGSRTTTFVSRLSAVVLAAAAAGALGTATANAAPASSGGGCTTGFYIEGCLSASGSHLEPDLYVLNNSGCSYVSIVLYNAGNDATIWQDANVNNGCAVGIHGPWALDTANSNVFDGATYYAKATIHFTNGSSEGAVSPNETFSY